MRANAPRSGTFGGGLRFNTSQHFYSYVSDTDKVPRRSVPFRGCDDILLLLVTMR
jgi:hypothetical protein